MTPEQVRAVPDPVRRFQLADRLSPVHDLHAAAIRKSAVRDLYRQLGTWRMVANRLGMDIEQAKRFGSR